MPLSSSVAWIFGIAALSTCVACADEGAETLARPVSAPLPAPRPRVDGPAEAAPAETQPAPVCDGVARDFGIELPTPTTVTVPKDSDVVPELNRINQVPAFCNELTDQVVLNDDDVVVPCGVTVDVDARGLHAKRIRVATGGVLRLAASTSLVADEELLLCPGAILRGVPAVGFELPSQNGFSVSITARKRMLLMGTLETHASYTKTPEHGTGGAVWLWTERLLFAGLIDAAGKDPPAGTQRGAGGVVTIEATKESFFSGTVHSGDGVIRVPVL